MGNSSISDAHRAVPVPVCSFPNQRETADSVKQASQLCPIAHVRFHFLGNPEPLRKSNAISQCPCTVGCPPACVSFLWCPSTLQCPSTHPGSPVAVRTLLVSACARSTLFFARPAPLVGFRPLFLWMVMQGMFPPHRIRAGPVCPTDSGSRNIRLPQLAHRAWCPVSRIFPCWHRRAPARSRCRSL